MVFKVYSAALALLPLLPLSSVAAQEGIVPASGYCVENAENNNQRR
ncbi:MAG: hypothetical protein ACJAX5_003026, partial [Patiriisocius sp.]